MLHNSLYLFVMNKLCSITISFTMLVLQNVVTVAKVSEGSILFCSLYLLISPCCRVFLVRV